jgi:putative ABC transport system substrate-binding protein
MTESPSALTMLLSRHTRRREFVAGLGSVAAWPVVARAQQAAMPVIGYLSAGSPGAFAPRLRAFHQGLNDFGYIEGRNVAIEYRWSGERYDELQAMAADLVHRQVAVIVADGPAVPRAKAATSTIPIVFWLARDPVTSGYVASLNRPGGNLTGVTSLGVELTSKRLELLHKVIPTAGEIALLVNPASPSAQEQSAAQAAAQILGLKLDILYASDEREIDAAFAKLAQRQPARLVITPDLFFLSQTERFAALSLRHSVPAIDQYREFAVAGGLMSYGGSITSFRIVGSYVGRILNGEKPANLPVQQATKIEFFINLKTATALGLTVPETLLATADEVIQ